MEMDLLPVHTSDRNSFNVSLWESGQHSVFIQVEQELVVGREPMLVGLPQPSYTPSHMVVSVVRWA